MAHHKYFMCRCSKKQEAECDDAYARAQVYMNNGSEEIMGGWVASNNFVTGAVVFLNWDFNINITGIHNDQWSVVTAELVAYEGSVRQTPITYWIECDRIEDAFAHLLVDAPKKPEDVITEPAG